MGGIARRLAWARIGRRIAPDLRETVRVLSNKDGRSEPTRWTIHCERLVDDTRRLRLSIAQVELPEGVCF
jgi:hypothetical protein